MKKLILILIIPILFLNCSDDTDNSRSNWSVSEWCVPKVAGVAGCQTPYTSNKDFFNRDIKGVTAGTVVMYHEDTNVKEYRRFLKKNN